MTYCIVPAPAQGWICYSGLFGFSMDPTFCDWIHDLAVFKVISTGILGYFRSRECNQILYAIGDFSTKEDLVSVYSAAMSERLLATAVPSSILFPLRSSNYNLIVLTKGDFVIVGVDITLSAAVAEKGLT